LALVTSKEIYRKANREGYAVGGYETYWLEAVQVFADAAEEARAPILIQVTPVRLRHFGIDYFEGLQSRWPYTWITDSSLRTFSRPSGTGSLPS
jgi:fructose/tagatose bisphosphate aldolase